MTSAPPQEEELTSAYKALLRTYPKSWQDDGRVDEILAVLLDGAAVSARTRPTLAERADLVLHGMGARLRPASYVISKDVRLRIAQLSLVAGASLSVFLVLFGEVRIPGISNGHSPNSVDLSMRHRLGPFLTLGVAVYGCWLIIVVLYERGSLRALRRLALVAAAAALVLPKVSNVTDHQRPPGGLLACLVLLALGVAAMPRFTRISRRGRVAMPVGITVIVAVLSAVQWLHSSNDGDGHWTRNARQARTMFYWSADGHGTQINRVLAGYGLWVLVALVIVAAAAWRWDHALLPAVIFLFAPWAVLGLGTRSFDTDHASRDAFIWTCAALSLLVLQGTVARAIVRSRPRS